MKRNEGKVALMSGASSGIGEATARQPVSSSVLCFTTLAHMLESILIRRRHTGCEH
jgi:NADP-dependent 3-hydroxy acid dehydrogenase YdfG